MTDSSRFHLNWKTPFLFSHHDKVSLEDLKSLSPSNLSSAVSPLRSSSSPYQTQTSLPRFDPFNTDISEHTTAKDTDLDELSNLLSRQFLDHVDAETPTITTVTNTISPTTTSKYSLPITSWRLDGCAKIREPWSSAFPSNGLLPFSSSSSQTTLLSQQDDHDSNGNSATDNNDRGSNTNISSMTNDDMESTSSSSVSPPSAAATWWDRYGPYGDDAEFDPTLPFYRGDDCDHTTTDSPRKIISTSNNGKKAVDDQPSNNGNGNQQQQQQQVLDMTLVALKKLSILFPDLDKEELEQTLAALDYDVERTIEAFLPRLPPPPSTTTTTGAIPASPALPILAATSVSTAPITATAEMVHLIKTPMSSTSPPPPLPPPATGSPKKRQVCRHYLAGECYRKDCWFAHDLEVKPCKFWLQGSCLKGDTCEFAHSLEEMDQVAKYHQQHHPVPNHHPSPFDHQRQYQPYHHQQQEQQYTPTTVADFPILVSRSNRKSKKSHNKKSFKK